MLKDLVKLADHLDAKGLKKEADYLDGVIKKLSQEYTVNPEDPSGPDSAATYRSESRDKALQTLERARNLVVEANNLLVNDEDEVSQTDRFYEKSIMHMRDAARSIDAAKHSLTGHGGGFRAGINVQHPDEMY
jgi:hypothetical protein